MSRYLIVAGVDFGTSYTKVVLRDNNTSGSNARVVTFPNYPDGLLPSLVGIAGNNLTPPTKPMCGVQVPYLKMVAAHLANGKRLEQNPVRMPAEFRSLCDGRSELDVVREFLAFYFAHVMAATERFIIAHSPWKDFDFSPGGKDDSLIYQLAVPTGLLSDSGATERLFRDAFIAGHEMRREIASPLSQVIPHGEWTEQVARVFAAEREKLEDRFQWQCLIYPEVAAAVQTVFRSPNASNGLYITMDVGAGTVDLNVFCRISRSVLKSQAGGKSVRRLDYYSAIVCALGVQNLQDPHRAVKPRAEHELLKALETQLQALCARGRHFQPNLGNVPGQRTWDRATLFIFGGGSHHPGYERSFAAGLIEHAEIYSPKIHNLPAARDLVKPPGIEFGRFAVAYGLSFFRPNLDTVRLPNELTTFRQLYPELQKRRPSPLILNWDD